jgi:hypothetical protein
MNPLESGKLTKKEAMKKLRSARSEWIKKASAAMTSQKNVLKSIKGHLEKGPATIPEVAEAIGMPPHEVLWFTAALKKYGEIVESEKDGGYFRYALAEKALPKES